MWLQLEWLPRGFFRSILRFLVGLAGLLILAVIARPLSAGSMYTFGLPAIELSIAIVIVGLLSGVAMPLQKLFELRPFVWVGRLSYGLYLWHVPIIGRAGGWRFLGPFRIVVGLALTFAVAVLSYYFVELRFLKLKEQFASA